MKCPKCEVEINEGTNFCPNCGAKLNEADAGTIIKKEEVVKVNDRTEVYSAISLLAFYSGIGMTLVSLFFAFKGFGLFAKRTINPITVWVTFGISVAIAIAGGIFYFVKFNKKK